MLTREENELIWRTGPGMPMGELFWLYQEHAELAVATVKRRGIRL